MIVVNAVMLYLRPSIIIKKVNVLKDCASLFEALKTKYYESNVSNCLYKKWIHI